MTKGLLGAAMVLVVFGVVVVLVIGLVVSLTSIAAQRERADAAQVWAQANGWQYTPEDPALVSHLHGPGFNKGHSRQALNVVRGLRGRNHYLSAEYTYKTEFIGEHGETSNRPHYMHAAGVVLLPVRPDIVVTPRSWTGRLAHAMGRNEVLTGDPYFDAAFRIDGGNSWTAQVVLAPYVRQYCMGATQIPFMIRGQWLFTWTKGKRNLQAVEREFQYLDGLAARIPQSGPPAPSF